MFIFKIKRTVSLTIPLLISLLSSGCNGNSSTGYNSPDSTGTLLLQLVIQESNLEKTNKAILPDLLLIIDHYEVILSGPNDEIENHEADISGIISIDSLVIGEWTINVTAINSDNSPIASGDANVVVVEDQTTNCNIDIIPIEGNGTLSLTITWNVDLAGSAIVIGQLESSTDAIPPILFLLDETNNTYEINSLPSGYYSLNVTIYDNSVIYGGMSDIVRIVADVTTTSSIDISPTSNVGEINLTITPEMSDPIVIEFSGTMDSIVQGDSFTINTIVDTTDVVYTWSLNGPEMLSGAAESSFSIPTDLEVGTHRLDVVIFTSDGLRGGSATHFFQVVPVSK